MNDPFTIFMPQTTGIAPPLVGVKSIVVSPSFTVFFTLNASMTTVRAQPFTVFRSTSIFTGTPLVTVDGVTT